MSSVLQHTKTWVQSFVIGYGLCPFAMRPFQEDRIRYVLVEGSRVEELVEMTFKECLKLQNTTSEVLETTIIVHPNLLTDFLDYISIVEQMQEDLEQLNLDGIIQLATFHPAYQFAETEVDAPENFTNRSPYPMIHLLRAESVERAIAAHPDTAQIPVENIKMMNRIGHEQLIKQNNEIIGKN